MIINKKTRIFLAVGLIFIITPFLAFSSRKSDLYVNTKANGTQDGSKSHPYRTIGSALEKADSKTEIHVAKGEYEENITLKKSIKLSGEDKEKTVIIADKNKWATVNMEDNSEISGFTIKKGKRGIWVDKHAKVNIIDCAIKYSEGDGIGLEGGDTKKTTQVYISKTEIIKNDRSGIFSFGPRKVVMVDSEISENRGDGIDLPRGSEGYFSGNTIKNNSKSGMKLVIDGSSIWTKKNSVRKNGRDGMEISSFGGVGRIDIQKSKFVENGIYGIAKLQRAGSATAWDKYLTFSGSNNYWGNKLGNISRIFIVR